MHAKLNSRKVVIYISTGLSTGGAERMLYNLLSKIDKMRFEPIVVSLMDRGTWGDRIIDLGISVRTVEMERGKPTPAALMRLQRIINEIKPDIIQGWMYHGNIAAQIVSFFIKQKIPILWSIHNSADSLMADNKMTAAIVKLGAWLSRFAASVAFVSQTSKSQHEALGYLPENACVIPNGFDTNLFTPSLLARAAIRSELGLADDSTLIGSICRFHPMKDHSNLLQAAALLLKARPDVHLVLAGTDVNDRNPQLQQQIQTLGISKNIHLLGERRDMPRLTAALDISTSTSAYGEAFPMVVGEAMACGVPCVVTDVGDSRWIVAQTGRVVPPKNPLALAQAWQELIAMSSEQRQALGAMARSRVEECFALDAIAAQYEKLYEQALSKR